MRCSSWILLGLMLAGCQGQSTTAPQAKQTTPFKNEPMPSQLAALIEEPTYETALSKINQLIGQRSSDPMLYSVRSSIHHRHGHPEAAVADLDKAISLNSKDARLFNNRGFVKLGMQALVDARADFDHATELAPEYANPYNNRGLLLIARGEYASAIEELDAALRLDADYVDAYNNRGFAALQAGRIDRALADFNTAIKLNPKYVNAYNNRGLLLARVGDLDNAIVDFTEAMILDPLNPKYYEHRREVYLRQSAVDLALGDETRHDWLTRLQELNTLINDSPRSTKLLIERARHYQIVDDQDKLVKDLDRALQIDPDCAPALAEHGRYCIRRKDFKGALTDAKRLQEVAPSQDVYSLCGDAYLGLKNYDKAIECYAEAHRIDASVAEAYYQKSLILQAAGQEDQAAQTLQHAIALNPKLDTSNDAPAPQEVPQASANTKEAADLQERGQSCIRDKDFSGALEAAAKLTELGLKQEAFSISGDAYLGLDDFDKAIECYAQARRVDEAVAEAYYRKARALKAAGQSEAAAETLKHARALDPKFSKPSDGRTLKAVPEPEVKDKEAADLQKQARACLEQKDFAAALKAAAKLAEMGLTQESFSICGDAYLGLENFDKAIDCYTQARCIDETIAEAYYRKAKALKAAGKSEAAAESLKQARALNPNVDRQTR